MPGLKDHIDKMNKALKDNQPDQVLKACIELGTFLQAEYPGKDLDQIQKVLRKSNEYSEYLDQELFSPHIIAALTEAGISAHMKVSGSDIENDKETQKLMNAIKLGAAIFGTIMGPERFNVAADNKLKFDMEMLIYNSLPDIEANREARASRIVDDLRDDCNKCKRELTEIISSKLDSLPDGNQYKDGKKIKIDLLVEDIKNNTGIFSSVNMQSDPATLQGLTDLKRQIGMYQKLINTDSILKSDISSNEKIKRLYNQPHQPVENIAATEPESRIARFFTKVQHMISNFSLSFHLTKSSEAESSPKPTSFGHR